MMLPRRALPLLAVAALPLHAGKCNPKPIGQIVLVVQSDLSIAKDIDTIRIEAFNNGAQKFQQDYDKIGPGHDEIQLPGTISLVASQNPSDVITIIVSARTGGLDGVPHVVRKVVTTIPPSRTAMLPLGIHFLCYDQATTDPTGDAAGKCAEGQSCVGGVCQSADVDSGSLPDYDPKSVTGDGSCFDGAACWTAPDVAAVDPETCSIPPVTGVNIALQVEGLGICGPPGRFVTLDKDDPVEGWTTGTDGRILLPSGVCVQLASKQIINVVTQPVASGNCGVKQLSVPTCGPWSASAKNPPAYAGPQALVGGQARPITVAVLHDTMLNADTVYWTNNGVGTTPGALRSITQGGGLPVTIADMMSTAPRSLISVDKNLLWTDAPGTPGTGAIFQSDGKTVTSIVPMLDSPEGLTSYGGKLFWTDFQDGAIYTSASDGTGKAKLIGGANYPFRVAADASYVYWTNEGTLGKTPPDGSVVRYKYTAATGIVETLADAQETPRVLAVDGGAEATAVYFANFDKSGSIVRVDLGATPGTPVVLASGQGYPNGIAVDGGYVYWTNRGDGTVLRLSTGAPPGTPPKVLASGQVAPGNLVVGESYIYWVNEGSSSASTGSVIKLAK